jgi:predicted component of type VI protein secretion system
MPILDSKYVREFLDKNEPRLDLVKTVFTPSGKKIDVAINFGVEFFRVFF